MTAEVLPFTGITKIDEPPEQVLEKAKGWGMDRCVVIGFAEDNSLRFGGSFSSSPEILLLLELAKRDLLARVPS